MLLFSIYLIIEIIRHLIYNILEILRIKLIIASMQDGLNGDRTS